MALSDKKILLILGERDFNDEEYDRVRKVLEFKGARVSAGSSRVG